MESHECANIVRKTLANGEVKEYKYTKAYNVKKIVSRRSLTEKLKTVTDVEKLDRISKFIDMVVNEQVV